MKLRDIQNEHREWHTKNFSGVTPSDLILGVVEELGELAHSHLKNKWGIRTNEDHESKAKDAVGDITIFLIAYCNEVGYDFQTILEETWKEVSKRDWSKHPGNGVDI